MAVINWGKPKIQFLKYVDGKYPESAEDWQDLDTPVQDTTTIETSEGEKKEAKEEGGAIIDTIREVANYSLKFSLYEKKGKEKQIADTNGIVEDLYAFRLFPENDKTNNGYLFKKCSVSFAQTYNAADGGRWEYTVDALKPDDGSAILQRYIAED